jgi:hypothetical protein
LPQAVLPKPRLAQAEDHRRNRQTHFFAGIFVDMTAMAGELHETAGGNLDAVILDLEYRRALLGAEEFLRP